MQCSFSKVELHINFLKSILINFTLDLFSLLNFSSPEDRGQFDLVMPDAKPTEPETYLCTTIRLDKNNTYYITGFDPQVRKHFVIISKILQAETKKILFSSSKPTLMV